MTRKGMGKSLALSFTLADAHGAHLMDIGHAA